MDFKSIGMNWYANLCEKLETVCTEVEDKVQETKVIERVQTSCLHVNKCFEELRQEFFPSSCASPVQEEVSDSSALETADTNDISGPHNESGDIPTTGKASCPSSILSEDGNFCGFLHPSSVNSTKCVDSIKSLEENDINILEPTTESTSSVTNEKDAPCPSLGEADTNDIKGFGKGFGDLSNVEKHTCPLSNSFQDGNPSSANSAKCLDSVKLLECDSANVSEPITEDNSSVNNERHAHCPSEEVASSRSEVALPSGPQKTTQFDPVLSALNDMSASSFFSDLSNQDHEKASVVPLINVHHTCSVEVNRDESCSHCEVGDDDVVDGTRSDPDVMCSLSTSCIDPLGTKTEFMEVTGHESCSQSGLIYENAFNATKCGSDVLDPVSASDMDPPFIPFEDLVCEFPPSCSISSKETPDTDTMSGFTGSSYSNAVELSIEDIEQFDSVQLEKSCIMIDHKDLQINPRPNKKRSLKKKLQAALGMRSRKQREYEQLAILYSDIDADINLPVKDLHLMKSAHELSEPDDWELV